MLRFRVGNGLLFHMTQPTSRAMHVGGMRVIRIKRLPSQKHEPIVIILANL